MQDFGEAQYCADNLKLERDNGEIFLFYKSKVRSNKDGEIADYQCKSCPRQGKKWKVAVKNGRMIAKTSPWEGHNNNCIPFPKAKTVALEMRKEIKEAELEPPSCITSSPSPRNTCALCGTSCTTRKKPRLLALLIIIGITLLIRERVAHLQRIKSFLDWLQ